MKKKRWMFGVCFWLAVLGIPARAEEWYEDILENRAYWVEWFQESETEQYPAAYALLDMDRDGTEELIIRSSNQNSEFLTFVVYRLDETSGKAVRVPVLDQDGYEIRTCFRGLFYSESREALTFSVTRTGSSFMGMDYFCMENGNLVYTGGYHFDEYAGYTFSLNDETKEITEEEYRNYSMEETGIAFELLPGRTELEEPEDIRITFDRFYDGNEEYGAVTARDTEGDILWTYQSGRYPAAQLNQVSEVGIHEGIYYLCDGGVIVALDLYTGEILWKNEDFGGSPSAVLFYDGKIYVSGYFGPDLVAVSRDGETLGRIGAMDQNLYWTFDLTAVDGSLYLFFEGGGEYGSGALVELDPDTLEVRSRCERMGCLDYGYLTKDMRVVNCMEYVTLRAWDSVDAPEKAQVPLGSYVEYLSEAENDFYKVVYSGMEGYVLADYLEFTDY